MSDGGRARADGRSAAHTDARSEARGARDERASDGERSSWKAPLPIGVRCVLALFALTLVLFTKDEPGSWADGSRLGTIQGLVEHGTLALDDTDYLWQGDKVRFGGRYYSHQPPMLALLGALPYAVLHHGLGRTIDVPSRSTPRGERPPNRSAHTYRILTWTLVGLPLLAGFASLARLLLCAGATPRQSAVLLFLASFGTLALPYALVLNQHGTAAGLVLIGLTLVARGRAASAGFVLALATTIDLTAVFALAAFAWPAFRGGGATALVRLALGALPPLALHLGVNLAVAGDLVPFGMHTEAFRYAQSPFMLMSLTTGNDAGLAGELRAYVAGALFGQSGLFSHHPWLVLALLSGVPLLLGRGARRHGLPAGVLAGAAWCALGITAFYLVTSRNFGGSSFGMRWFAVFSPLLALFPAAWLGTRPQAPPESRVPEPVVWLLALSGLWSVGASALGAVQPWAKFAYFWHQKPESRLARPDAERPTWGRHLEQELLRVWNFRASFDRETSEADFAELLSRYARVRLRRWGGFSAEEQERWTRDGLAELQGVADQMRVEGDRSMPAAVCHFWIGKLHEALGAPTHARAEYGEALGLWPRYEAAHKALVDLEEKAVRPR